jgi:hypothetical protein
METGEYGTGGGAPTDSTEAIHMTDASYSDKRNPMIEQAMDAYIAPRADVGALDVTLSLEGKFRPVAHTNLLQAVHGGMAGSVYTIDAAVPAVVQLGEKVGLVTRSRNYYGVGINKVDFSFTTKEYVGVTYDGFASEAVEATYDAALTYSAETPLVFWRATLSNGTNPIIAKEATLSIDRALDDSQYVLGSFKRYRLTQTDLTSITGSLTLTEDQIDQIKLAQYGSTTGTAVPANNALGTETITFTCLKTDGTAGCVFTVPVIYDSFDFKASKVSELGKTVNFISVGTGYNLTVS